MSTVLEIKNLKKNDLYGNPVIDGLDLEVKQGEFVSICGPRACGKSLLFRMISGFDKPDGGMIKTFGKEVKGIGPDVQLIFQESQIFPWMRVLDNVMFGPLSRGVPKEEAKKASIEWLARVGLAKFAGVYPWMLSGGMQRRCAIAMVLVNKPKLVLCDELLGGLDWITRHVVSDEFVRIWYEEKPTVLYVTHMLEEAVYLSQKVYLLSDKPAKTVADWEIKLPPKRWEVKDLRFAKETADYVEKVRLKFEEVVGHVAK